MLKDIGLHSRFNKKKLFNFNSDYPYISRLNSHAFPLKFEILKF